MQDPSSLYSQIKSQVNHHQQQHPNPQFPEQEHLNCPRCDSANTKFCYYNNYNLSQPRHFCKSCKRYWTKGGTLRNIPVGGGSRKNAKRSSSSSTSSDTAATSAKRPAPAVTASAPAPSRSSNDGEMRSVALNLKGDEFGGQFGNFTDVNGNFSSLLGSSEGQFGNLFDGLGPNGPNLGMGEPFSGPDSGQNVDPQVFESGSSNGWTDLAMYTPRSTFQ